MWSTRSIFVSSTFTDMQAERDYLRTHVFPALEEILRERHVHVEWVDLRVGVPTASIEENDLHDAQVLKVCFDEVDRCRPFMIALLGDRYGWIPDEDRLREAVGSLLNLFPSGARPSVTAAEIGHGLLSDKAKRERSFVYFRQFKKPPPYGSMPPEEARRYSDTLAPRSEAARGLADLKRHLRERMPKGHVWDYSAEWNNERRRVVGLEAFGDRVLDDLRTALELETANRPAAPLPWQQTERNALDDFVEDRARDVVGRADLIDRLVGVATQTDGSLQGVCITGEAGSGKSTLFGAVYRRLKSSDGPCVLAHAAGASIRSRSIDVMLRRWIGELSVQLGSDVVVPDDAEPHAIEAAFASLLERAASRVVILIDALDQFERTSRARFLTWLPHSLPARVRLIASAIPGEASNVLRERAGIETIALPGLDAAAAREIITAICRRYHRAFEPQVIEDLLARRDGERPAWSNPLWLVLAVEDLNLIDADDLAEARRTPERGSVQIRHLMCSLIARYPTDISRLYAHTFERAETHISTVTTRAFLRLIAISRAGWRQQDFEVLLEGASGTPWSALAFAQLRRMFRGQLRRHGTPDHWDFNHAQMRHAVRERLLRDDSRERQLHALIAYHLLDLPDNDPLRCSETMFHLLGSESWPAAAMYYGDAALNEEASAAASQVLIDEITAADDDIAAAGRVARLLAASVEDAARANAAHRLLYGVGEAIKGRASLAAQQRLLAAVESALARVLASVPDDPRGLRDLSACRVLAGDLSMQAGHRLEALGAYRSGLEIAEDVSRQHPNDDLIRSFIAASSQRIGDALISQGLLDEALAVYRRSLSAADDLVGRSPASVTMRCAQALSLQKIGECLLKQGAASEALAHFERSTRIFEDVVAQNPSATEVQIHLAQNYLNAGLFVAAVDGEGAIAMLRKCLELRKRIAAADPHDMAMQREFAVACSLLGDALTRLARDAEAREVCQCAVAIFKRVAGSDPQNLRWRHDLSLGCRRLAEVELEAHRYDDAVKLLREAIRLGETLVQADPTDPGWRESLLKSYDVLSFVLRGQGRIEEASWTDERSARLREG